MHTFPGHLLKEVCCYAAWCYGILQNKIQLDIIVPESCVCDITLENICISIHF